MTTSLCKEGFAAIDLLPNSDQRIHCQNLIALQVSREVVLSALFESKCGRASEMLLMKEREDTLGKAEPRSFSSN
jgi:hypothetical protein